MMLWIKVPIPPEVAGMLSEGSQMFVAGPLKAIVSRDPLPTRMGGVELRYHLSVSHPERYPTWDELGDARDALLPEEAFFCMAHPPRHLWLNLHSTTLHLWQIADPVLIDQWRAEGEDAQAMGYGAPTREGP